MIMHLTKDNFDSVTSSGLVLVDFWATWCGPCKMIAGEVVKIADEYEDALKVGKVNVDEQPYLAEKFAIDVIPTLVDLENGEEVKRTSGYMTCGEIEKFFGLKK